MTLLAVMRKLWRYRFVTLPIIALAVAGSAYILAFKAPVYESSVEYILFGPAPAPTESDVLKNPELASGSDNPYARVGDMSVVAQLMSTRMNSDEARVALAQQGANPAYTVQPGGGFGYSTPTIQVTGTGPTGQAAVKTADIVAAAMTRALDHMQKDKGVAPRYRITTQAVVPAHEATLRPSGKLRALVGVIAAAAVFLFFVVSLLDALATLRRERHEDYPVVDEAEWEPDTDLLELVPASADGATPIGPRFDVDEGRAIWP